MALYDDLNRQPRVNRQPQARVTAVPYGLSHQTGASALASRRGRLIGTLQAVGLAFLMVCWIAGAYAGIVYWSLQASLLGVIASALIPGIAATSTWSAFAALERPEERRR